MHWPAKSVWEKIEEQEFHSPWLEKFLKNQADFLYLRIFVLIGKERDITDLYLLKSWPLDLEVFLKTTRSNLNTSEISMALVPLRLLLDHAAENGYGIPAFNVTEACHDKAHSTDMDFYAAQHSLTWDLRSNAPGTCRIYLACKFQNLTRVHLWGCEIKC